MLSGLNTPSTVWNTLLFTCLHAFFSATILLLPILFIQLTLILNNQIPLKIPPICANGLIAHTILQVTIFLVRLTACEGRNWFANFESMVPNIFS